MDTQTTATLNPTTTFETLNHSYSQFLRDKAADYVAKRDLYAQLCVTLTAKQEALQSLPKTPTGRYTKAVCAQLSTLSAEQSTAHEIKSKAATAFGAELHHYLDGLHSKVYTFDKVSEVIQRHGFKPVTNIQFFNGINSVYERLENAPNREQNLNQTFKIFPGTDYLFHKEGARGFGLYIIVHVKGGEVRFRFSGTLAPVGGNYRLKEDDGLSDLRTFNSDGFLIDINEVADTKTYNQPGDGSHTVEHWVGRASDIIALLTLAKDIGELVNIDPNSRRRFGVNSTLCDKDAIADGIIAGERLYIVRDTYRKEGYDVFKPRNTRHGNCNEWFHDVVYPLNKIDVSKISNASLCGHGIECVKRETKFVVETA